jgi:hypothetical protein
MNPALGLALGAVLVMTLGVALRAGSRQRAAGIALLGAAAGLVLVRQFGVAAALALLGLSLLQRKGAQPPPSPGQRSEIRSRGLHMTLDHDSGEMEGEVLAGGFTGAKLSELNRDELRALAAEFETMFPESDDSLSLLLAYMEREDGGPDDDSAPPHPDGTNMADAEAYRILGLEPGADVTEVRKAYRRMIRRVHPDLGGSSPLAAMLNAAKQHLDPD